MNWDLRLGDCLGFDGIVSLPEKSCDAVITDPPYEVEAHTKGRRIKPHGGGVAEQPVSFAPITERQRTVCGVEFGRLARRWVLVFCQIEATHLWRSLLEQGGLEYVRTCIWVKPDGQPQLTGDRPGVAGEAIVVAHRPGRKRWNGGGRRGVFEHTRHQDHATPRELRHPTVKPLPLMEELVRLFTDPGELILDPFAGSGTTGVAAVRHGRRFIGWELDAKYYEVARRRIGETREQLSLLA